MQTTVNTSTNTSKITLSKNRIIAFLGMTIGMFMAILDIQIVASSLSSIGSGLMASKDELSWIQTSYLIAEVIIIPLTGFLARAFSTRISYFVAVCGFTVMSLGCSLAWSIQSMIIFRLLQGIFGGAMIPTVVSSIYVIFPPKQRPVVTVFIGLVITVAPTFGPIIGGYITELFSWHYMFLINIIPGIFSSIAVFLWADFDEPDYSLLKNFDYIGVILMSIGLGSMQYVLEEGTKRDWFDDTVLLNLGIIIVIALLSFIYRELTIKNPVLDLKVFKDTNFSLGCIYSFVTGIGMYGVVFLVPMFLFMIADMNPMQIGITMAIGGAIQFVTAPILGKILSKGVDFRILLACGFVSFAFGCYTNSFLTVDSRYWELFWPQIIRGACSMMCFVPIQNIALSAMPKDKIQNASAIFNLTRNLGGAIGIALIGSVLIDRTSLITQRINENISYSSATGQNFVTYLNQFMISSGQVSSNAIIGHQFMYNMINKEAIVIAMNDIFALISILFILSLVFVPLISKVELNDIENIH